ncbi:MAG: hypothetical protein QM771_09560 [Nitrospira sp.]
MIAEEGLAGIKLGQGPDGEAFVAFQEYILKLKRKGVILTVCSKNNYADAIQPFEKHPEMRAQAAGHRFLHRELGSQTGQHPEDRRHPADRAG